MIRIVVGLLEIRPHEYLMGKRAEGRDYPGLWELPGGKINTDEQPEEAVVRELQEELGFKTEDVKIVQVYLHKIKSSPDEKEGVLVISYLCKIMDGVEARRHDFGYFNYINVEIRRESGDIWEEVYCIIPIKVVGNRGSK